MLLAAWKQTFCTDRDVIAVHLIPRKEQRFKSSEITELRKKARMKWEHECSRVSGSNQSLQHALPPIIETAFRGIASFDVYL